MYVLAIVSEKEKRLIEIMKINGMKMNNYWFVNYVFYYIFYSVTMFIFIFAGRYIFRFRFFTQTGLWIQLVMFNGWGMAQISWAFFTSVFINQQTIAAIFGYLVAIYMLIMSQVLCNLIYNIPFKMPWYFQLCPTFSFVRSC